MASLFTASTLEDGPGGFPERADSFFYNAEDDLSFNQWHSLPTGDHRVVYERVFEPHPSLLQKNGRHKTYTSAVFVSRRPATSAAAALAAQWRASQPSSAASSTASSCSLSTPETRLSISGDSTTSKTSKRSGLSTVSRILSLGRRPST